MKKATRFVKRFKIFERTAEGRLVDAEYGYGETTKYLSFAVLAEAEEWLAENVDEFRFTGTLVIVAVYEKEWV